MQKIINKHTKEPNTDVLVLGKRVAQVVRFSFFSFNFFAPSFSHSN